MWDLSDSTRVWLSALADRELNVDDIHDFVWEEVEWT